ncbi:MAG: GNAT family N-acetyltransferase [Candidatus Omnitrophota bacterium]|nr:GNAT family N-acetyltransferase [Candidatus Omnitrophota bacterium]
MASGESAPYLFQGTLPVLKDLFTPEEFKSRWIDIDSKLESLAQDTNNYNRERILKLFTCKYLPLIKDRGLEFFRWADFYIEVIRKEPRLCLQVLEGIIEAVEKNYIDNNLPPQEKELIFSFVEFTRSFNQSLFKLYRKEGKDGLKEVMAFAAKISSDNIGEAALITLMDALQVKGINDNKELEEALVASVQIAIPSSGASFVKKYEILGLFRKFREAGDRRGNIPKILRNTDFGENKAIELVDYLLKAGQVHDPEGKIVDIVNRLRYQDRNLSREEKIGKEKEDKEALIRALKDWFQGFSDPAKKDNVLEKFFAWVSHNDALGEKVDAINEGYGSLALLESLFMDKDNLISLLRQVLKELREADLPLTGATAKEVVSNPKVLVSQLSGIWMNQRLSIEERRARVGHMLTRFQRQELETKIVPLIQDNDLKEIIRIVPAGAKRMAQIDIIEALFAEPLGQIQKEKAKFSPQKHGEVSLEFRIVKGIPYGLWGLNAGVCVATDIELWKDNNFMLLAMIDKNTHQAVGFVHLFRVDINGEWVLTVPGIEPSVEFLSQVKAEEVYPLIEDALKKVARTGGFQALYIPTEKNILSNRADIAKIVMRKYAANKKMLTDEVRWNHVPQPYPLKEVYILWENNAKPSYPPGGETVIQPQAPPIGMGGISAEEQKKILTELAEASGPIDIAENVGAIEAILLRLLDKNDTVSYEAIMKIFGKIDPVMLAGKVYGLAISDKDKAALLVALKDAIAEAKIDNLGRESWIGDDLWNKFISLNNGEVPLVLNIYNAEELLSQLAGISDEKFVCVIVNNMLSNRTEHRMVIDRAGYIRENARLIHNGFVNLESYEFLMNFSIHPEAKAVYFYHISIGRKHVSELRGQGLMSKTFNNIAKVIRDHCVGYKIAAAFVEREGTVYNWFRKNFNAREIPVDELEKEMPYADKGMYHLIGEITPAVTISEKTGVQSLNEKLKALKDGIYDAEAICGGDAALLEAVAEALTDIRIETELHRDAGLIDIESMKVKSNRDKLKEMTIQEMRATNVFLAVREGGIAGFTTVLIDPERIHNCINLVGVSPKWQGRYIGSDLLDEAVRCLRQAGVNKFIAVTRNDKVKHYFLDRSIPSHDRDWRLEVHADYMLQTYTMHIIEDKTRSPVEWFDMGGVVKFGSRPSQWLYENGDTIVLSGTNVRAIRNPVTGKFGIVGGGAVANAQLLEPPVVAEPSYPPGGEKGTQPQAPPQAGQAPSVLQSAKSRIADSVDSFIAELRKNRYREVDSVEIIGGRRIINVHNKEVPSNSKDILGTAGCHSCMPIICRIKNADGTYTNHLVHFVLLYDDFYRPDQTEEQADNNLSEYINSELDKFFKGVGSKESTFIIAYDDLALGAEIARKISERLIKRHSNSRVLHLPVQNSENVLNMEEGTVKTAIMMSEGIGIDAGEPSSDDLLPQKGTSRLLCLTWQEIDSIFKAAGQERNVVADKDFLQELSIQPFSNPLQPQVAPIAKLESRAPVLSIEGEAITVSAGKGLISYNERKENKRNILQKMKDIVGLLFHNLLGGKPCYMYVLGATPTDESGKYFTELEASSAIVKGRVEANRFINESSGIGTGNINIVHSIGVDRAKDKILEIASQAQSGIPQERVYCAISASVLQALEQDAELKKQLSDKSVEKFLAERAMLNIIQDFEKDSGRVYMMPYSDVTVLGLARINLVEQLMKPDNNNLQNEAARGAIEAFSQAMGLVTGLPAEDIQSELLTAAKNNPMNFFKDYTFKIMIPPIARIRFEEIQENINAMIETWRSL